MTTVFLLFIMIEMAAGLPAPADESSTDRSPCCIAICAGVDFFCTQGLFTESFNPLLSTLVVTTKLSSYTTSMLCIALILTGVDYPQRLHCSEDKGA